MLFVYLAGLAVLIFALSRSLEWMQQHRRFPPPEFWVALFTVALAVETGISLYILDRTDTALHSAAQAAADANKLNATGLRPWIDFDVFDIGTGFSFNREDVDFGARYSLKNTGRLPAMIVNPHFEMRPLTVAPGQTNEIADVIKERQSETCKGKQFDTGNTVFPGQSFVEAYQVTVKASRRSFDGVANLGQPVFVVLITGCVVYQLALVGTYGHTAASILVGRPDGTEPLNFVPQQGTIAANQLVRLRAAIELAD